MAINLSGPICTTGYGTVAFNLLKALDQAGAEPALFPIGQIDGAAFPHDHDLIKRCLDRSLFFNVDAPSFRVWHQFALADCFGRGKRLSMSFTELDRLKPLEVHHMNSMDLLFQPSEWAKQVAELSGVTTPQVVVPCAVDTNIFWPDEFHSTHETIFVHAGKWEYRKGADFVLKAFLEAFTPDDSVRLVLMCDNPFLDPIEKDAWVRYYGANPLADKITLVQGRFPDQSGVARVLRNGHCGFFPARAEGFNLEAAEMLAMGRHAIMTDYSAHTQYASEAGARLIPIDEADPAHDSKWFFADDPAWEGQPGGWASLGEKQLRICVDHLRSVHQERLSGELRINQSGIDYFTKWTWNHAAEAIIAAVPEVI